MGKPINIYQVEKNVKLADGIFGVELIKPGLDGILGAHVIGVDSKKEYPRHTHPYEHVLYLAKGSGWMVYWRDNQEYRFPLNEGDTFHLAGNIPHQVGAYSEGAIFFAVSPNSKSLHDPERMIILSK